MSRNTRQSDLFPEWETESTQAIVHDFDTQQGVDYRVMEYISGTTLSEKLARGKLPEKEVVVLGVNGRHLRSLLCADGYIHQIGLRLRVSGQSARPTLI